MSEADKEANAEPYACDMCDRYERDLATLQAKVKELEAWRESMPERLLAWRGIEPGDACQGCGGAGQRTYADGSTWRRGGGAGQAITNDVCDKCWGTGSRTKPGTDLRRLTADLSASRAECAAMREALEEVAAMLRSKTGWPSGRMHSVVEAAISSLPTPEPADAQVAMLREALDLAEDYMDHAAACADKSSHPAVSSCDCGRWEAGEKVTAALSSVPAIETIGAIDASRVRREALEEAAKVVERPDPRASGTAAYDEAVMPLKREIADEIRAHSRALKEKP